MKSSKGRRTKERMKTRRVARANPERVDEIGLVVQQQRALIGRHVDVEGGGRQAQVEQHEGEDVQRGESAEALVDGALDARQLHGATVDKPVLPVTRRAPAARLGTRDEA